MKSEYLDWVKTRRPARFNLAGSAIAPYPLAELGARMEDLEINGPSVYGYRPLQEAIATHCGVPATCIVAASGTSMANFIAMAALIAPGDEVVIEEPAYDPLLAVARYLGAKISRFNRESPLKITTRPKLIVVTNLHNPTCTLFEDSALIRLAETGARVLVDEVYLECMYGQGRTAFRLGDRFVCTSSLTKAYGLGGLRCGWIIAEPGLAKRMWQLKDLIDPSAPHPSELLSVIAFRNADRIVKGAKGIIAGNRALLADFLSSCPHLELAMPDYGTCVFPRMRSGNSDELCEILHNDYDTDVVPGRFFERPDHFRVGIGGDPQVLSAGLERLNTALHAR